MNHAPVAAAALPRALRRAAAAVPPRVIVAAFMDGLRATPHEPGEVTTDLLARWPG